MRSNPRTAKLAGRLRAAGRWLFRSKTLFLNDDFTRQIVARYCSGTGCEIGPGANPQTNPRNTYYVDRYHTYRNQPIHVDCFADASALPFASDSLDYVFSSHVLEHCPDTLATLKEWLRVLRPGGRLLLRLPHGLRTFDKGRAITPLTHHLEDYERRVGTMDPSPWEEFERVAIPNFPHHWKHAAQRPDGSYDFEYIVRHGHLHYHVWTQTEMLDLLRYLGCPILFVIDENLDRLDSFTVVSEKLA